MGKLFARLVDSIGRIGAIVVSGIGISFGAWFLMALFFGGAGTQIGAIFFFIGLIGTGYLIWDAIFYKPAAAHNPHLRGAKLVGGDDLISMIRAEGKSCDIEIAHIPVPYEIENRGFLFSGAPGSGKSVAVTNILDILATRGRGDRCFIADRQGVYCERFFGSSEDGETTNDVILNPLDSRSVSWSPLAEIQGEWDCEGIAQSMIPDAQGESGEWNKYAQAVIGAILRHCWKYSLDNAEIYRLAIVADIAELREITEGTSAAGLLAKGNEKMFGSVRGIVSTYLSPYQYLCPSAGREAFSIKAWVQGGKGWAYFNYRGDQRKALAPLIAASIDIFNAGVMSLSPDEHGRRIWLVADEFASLGRVSSMEDFLTNARKQGGVAILGMQSISQVWAAYGRENAQSMLSSIGTWTVLRTPDADTSEYLSRFLGDHQVMRIVNSGGSNDGPQGSSSHNNWSQQYQNERIVMPSELQNLPNLDGFLNLAGHYPICPIRLPIPQPAPDVVNSAYVQREDWAKSGDTTTPDENQGEHTQEPETQVHETPEAEPLQASALPSPNTCPNCGSETGEQDKFCAACGHRLAPPENPAPVDTQAAINALLKL